MVRTESSSNLLRFIIGCTENNKKVTFAVHAVDDDPSEPYLDGSDILAESFEVSESSSRDNDTNVSAEKHDACSPSHSQEEALDSPNQQLDDAQVFIDNQSIYAAEKIVKKRKRKGKMQYKVKWLFYPEDQSTWEPEENILGKGLIEHFENGKSEISENLVCSMFESQFSICFILRQCCVTQQSNFNQ